MYLSSLGLIEDKFKVKEIKPTWDKLLALGQVWPVLGKLKNGQGIIISGITGNDNEIKLAYLDPTSKVPGFKLVSQGEWEEISGDFADEHP